MAFYHGMGFPVFWRCWLLLVLAIGSGAGYVCVINDITDREEDERAHKSNAMSGRSALFRATALGFCLLPGLAAVWLMRDYPITLLLYGLNWVAFTLYSLPPFRLKVRGIAGVLADTCGGQFLPTLWAAALISEAGGYHLELAVAIPLAVWAFALGLRGILEHQLRDVENDRIAQVATAAALYGRDTISRLILRVIFPFEALALLALLIGLHLTLVWPLLAFYLLLESRHDGFARLWAFWQRPGPGYWLPLAEYYKFYFPMTFIIALSWREPSFLVFLALQFVLFPRSASQFRRSLANLCGLRREGLSTGRVY